MILDVARVLLEDVKDGHRGVLLDASGSHEQGRKAGGVHQGRDDRGDGGGVEGRAGVVDGMGHDEAANRGEELSDGAGSFGVLVPEVKEHEPDRVLEQRPQHLQGVLASERVVETLQAFFLSGADGRVLEGARPTGIFADVEADEGELKKDSIVKGEYVLTFNGVEGCRLGRIL